MINLIKPDAYENKNIYLPECGHKQKFYHVITEANFSSWECQIAEVRIKYDPSISIPTSVAIVLGLILILQGFDPPLWIGCLIAGVYMALASILFIKQLKLNSYVMKKIKYNFVFFIFYSVFLTLSLFLFDRPALRNVISAAIVSLLMVLVFYLFDRYRERKKKDKVE